MKFRTKLMLLYAVFFFFVVLVIGIIFYRYNIRRYMEDETENLQLVAEQVLNQFVSVTEKMEYRMDYMLSDPEVLRAMIILGDSEGMRREYVESAKDTIQNSMIIDSTMNTFYRVIFFNESGQTIAMRSVENGIINNNIKVEDVPGTEEAKKAQGKPVLVNTHKDTWGYKNEAEVFSMIRKVLGRNTGYIEIQYDLRKLEDMLSAVSSEEELILLCNETELLFSTAEDANTEEFYGEEFIYGDARQQEHGLCVLVRADKSAVIQEARYLLSTSIFVMAVAYLLLFSSVCIISNYLTKPLGKLRGVIESTEIENLGEAIKLDESDDEIVALCKSYQKTMKRLEIAIQRERQMAMLQMEAQFDFLQAQVNPHFIYNVLNVISGKGIENGDESICTMCSKLASMLRYSADTHEKYATVSREIEYLNQYLFLLKCRYDHKLNFNIDIAQELKEQMIPKIVLQQIVENCMKHGFVNKVQDMQIEITGIWKGGRFRITVQDNGQGFTEKSLELLRQKTDNIREQILYTKENIAMKIGGMGLVNTYGRLLLMYQEGLDFYMGNNETGAVVWFEAPASPEGQVK